MKLSHTVDGNDYLAVFDIMKKPSCDQIVDHVLLTGADTLLWRHQETVAR